MSGLIGTLPYRKIRLQEGGYKAGNMCGYKTGIKCGYKTNHSKIA